LYGEVTQAVHDAEASGDLIATLQTAYRRAGMVSVLSALGLEVRKQDGDQYLLSVGRDK